MERLKCMARRNGNIVQRKNQSKVDDRIGKKMLRLLKRRQVTEDGHENEERKAKRSID